MMMDFSQFPAPYDAELAYFVGRARQRLSPEGAELLERVVLRPDPANLDDSALRYFEETFGTLPQKDQEMLLALIQHFRDARAAMIAEAQGEIGLFEQLQRVLVRAQALDPAFAARGDNVTVGEAVAILKRYGEPVGVSDEVLEMMIEEAREDE
jgi:hypothetical protein